VRNSLIAGVLLAACVALSGCSTETVESAKKDVERNTKAVREGAEKVEKVVKPVAEIAAPIVKPVVDAAGKEVNKKAEQLKVGGRVTVAIQANEKLPKTIRVDADPDGMGVKLRGYVKTADQKKLAERVARETLGKEKRVQNDLKIGEPPAEEEKPTEKKRSDG
jgi:predicted small secreted protein